MSEDAADETAIAAAIFAVDVALPFDPYTTKRVEPGGRLVLRCARNLNLNEDEVFDALAAYKQFMVLKAVCKDFDATKLSPPPLVDEIWHEHILDTRGYRAFCDAAFKQFVDHDPDGVLDCGARRVRRERTLHKLKECFEDEYDRHIWTYPLENSFKRKYAVVRDEQGPQPSTSGGSLNIRVRSASGREEYFKVMPTTPLERVFDAWSTQVGVCAASVRFLFDGSRVRCDQTPADIGMEDGDQLDCIAEMRGC
ncbi:unnamed protein product [Pelagomonas calceolata]|jgi:small ubiquitin-related modifier|uniref:Ubiquitin-like domain-containing protein n=1 Tax=Pelagomonas calceolata TaxID=35677 RepID=A0A7S4A856_9STRA|nr:unnamed protein product [Pelagomonas calceolata]